MSIRVVQSGHFAAAIAIAAILAVGALSRTTTAFNPQPDPPAFGMIGISEGQTARLNFTNVAGPSDVQPGPCRATLQFFDADGNVLASQRVSVPAGHAASLDYVAAFGRIDDPAGTPLPTRAEIRGAVDPLAGGVAPGPCRSTIEIFDNLNGRTSVLQLPAVQRRAQ